MPGATLSTQAKDLPRPLNSKVQKEWCVRVQKLHLPFKKGSQIMPIAQRSGYKFDPKQLRSLGAFQPPLKDIPCGSEVAMQMMGRAFSVPDKSPWCHLNMPMKMMTKCGKTAWQTGQEWGPIVNMQTWGNSKLWGPTKFWGWDKTQLGQDLAMPVAWINTHSRYCGLWSLARRGKPVNWVDNTFELIWWYKPADPTAECAEEKSDNYA